MKVLVVDTETTGLPERGNPSVFSEKEKWPHIIQLSFLLYDTDINKIISCVDEIIKLDYHIPITTESIKIHGITRTTCQRKGILINKALLEFYEALEACDIVVGHNISFDKRMIMVETNRINDYKILSRFWNTKREYCTMKNAVDICKIETTNKYGNKYYKYPKLSELHKHLFKTIPNGLHDSMADVLICLRNYIKMEHKQDICHVGCSRLKALFKLYCE